MGSFSNFNFSIYAKSLIPGSFFVALLWTFSIAIYVLSYMDTILLRHNLGET